MKSLLTLSPQYWKQCTAWVVHWWKVTTTWIYGTNPSFLCGFSPETVTYCQRCASNLHNLDSEDNHVLHCKVYQTLFPHFVPNHPMAPMPFLIHECVTDLDLDTDEVNIMYQSALSDEKLTFSSAFKTPRASITSKNSVPTATYLQILVVQRMVYCSPSGYHVLRMWR